MFKEINLRNHSSLHKLFYSLVICGFANLVALIIFMFTSHIYWLQAIPLAIGMFIGGYIGPAILRRVPEKPVRIFIASLAFIQAGYFFYTAYLQ
ncbi:hypothetical protein CEE82_01905 [Lactobacillus crispatus]|nr:hypothetical protein CEE96_01905 [Lactobacillus crispatus]TDN14589.1 hypothetical protein CEE82_01905 [Lactobacillus crispatus]TDN17048.1 hypothetical protein CEE81_01875 [Lactobacillus crispatus]